MSNSGGVRSFSIHFGVDNANAHIELKELSLGNIPYRAAPPLRFHVTYDAEDRLYDLDGDFEIALSANSRVELLRELHEVLSMLWADNARIIPA